MHAQVSSIAKVTVSLGMLAGLFAQPASAQQGYGPPGEEAGPNYRHASTVAQGYLDGMASYVRAMGLYRHNAALAKAYAQEARSQYLSNRQQRLKYRMERRDLWRKNVGSRRRHSAERVARIQGDKLPPALEPWELQAETGRLAWPSALLADEFMITRKTIEKAMAKRSATNSGRGSVCHHVVEQAVLTAQKKLGEKLRSEKLGSSMFLRAHKFLRSVRREAQLPYSPIQLAQQHVARPGS